MQTAEQTHATAAWMTARRNQGSTPRRSPQELVGNGWSADDAARRALQSLRSSDRQPVLWFSLCWSAGLAAVGFTTAAHQLLAPFPDRELAASALTLSVVMAPIASCVARWPVAPSGPRPSPCGHPSDVSGSAPWRPAPPWSGSSD